MTWVWEKPDWPATAPPYEYLTAPRLFALARRGGELQYALDLASSVDRTGIWVARISEEAISTSAIEGVHLSADDILVSLRMHLRLPGAHPPSDARAAAITKLILDACDQPREPLSEQLLHQWHRDLMAGPVAPAFKDKIIVGDWRRPNETMQIVSGRIDKPAVYYEAPPGSAVPGMMQDFIAWYNATAPGGSDPMPAVLRGALCHVWFEQIHPYEDGNGRIGRALVDRVMFQDPNSGLSLSSLSAEIHRDSKSYMRLLEQLGKGRPMLNRYLDWFFEICHKAQDRTELIVSLAAFKGRYYEMHARALNTRQQKIMRKMFDRGTDERAGGMTPRSVMAFSGASRATATRDLTELAEKGLLTRCGKGRAVSYQLPPLAEKIDKIAPAPSVTLINAASRARGPG